MRTLVQKVFGNSITHPSGVLHVFPDSKLQLEQVSKELQKKLENKRAAELTVDEKIARDIAALRAKIKTKA